MNKDILISERQPATHAMSESRGETKGLFSRNDPCPCGSGEKYKKCCLAKAAVQNDRSKSVKAASHDFNTINALPPSELLLKAVALHQANQLEEAKVAYQSLLKNNPHDSDALHYLGLIAFQKGSSSDAACLIEQAIKLNGNIPAFHFNLGNVYKQLDQLDFAIDAYLEAIRLDPRFLRAYLNLGDAFKGRYNLGAAVESYHKALLLKPDCAETHNKLGVVLVEQGKLDEAATSFRQALAIKPYYVEALIKLGSVLHRQGRLDEAVASYRKVLKFKPDANAYCDLGIVLYAQGKFEEALANLRKTISLDPGNGIALHLIATVTGEPTEQCPSQYIEWVFDGYANTFDTHLVRHLKYDIPKQLVALINEVSGQPVEKLDILDLGCGTGLVGLEVSAYARQLVGVDISGNMLKKAAARKLYQRLEQSDILSMMRKEAASRYDVVIVADVYIYIGKVDEVVKEINRLLRPGGMLAFSNEDFEPSVTGENPQNTCDDYCLNLTGRYAQSSTYLNRLASENGFQILRMEKTQIRLEKEKTVHGCISLWQKK